MVQNVPIKKFRSVFKAIEKDVLTWFPGHMDRGLKQMQQKLRSVDCIIEVHDARIPISGRNTDFKHILGGIKPHILVLNKLDLIDSKMMPKIRNHLSRECENIVFTNSKDQKCKGIRSLFPMMKNLIENCDRYNRVGAEDHCVMIIGIPNVGKSSLINALRVKNLHKGNATQVGAKPGITRSVLHKIKMCEKPLFYLIDTPGILTPKVESVEVGLKLASCATINDHLVGEAIIADYLLFWLNQNKHYEYVDYFELKEPTDDILQVLNSISFKYNQVLRIKDTSNNYVIRPDFDQAATYMLSAFRNGKLGKIMLDEDLLSKT